MAKQSAPLVPSVTASSFALYTPVALIALANRYVLSAGLAARGWDVLECVEFKQPERGVRVRPSLLQ